MTPLLENEVLSGLIVIFIIVGLFDDSSGDEAESDQEDEYEIIETVDGQKFEVKKKRKRFVN